MGVPAATLPEQRNFGGGGGAARRQHLDRSALVVGAADVSLALEVGQVLVHRGQGLEPEVLGDLLEAGRVALVLDVALQIARISLWRLVSGIGDLLDGAVPGTFDRIEPE